MFSFLQSLGTSKVLLEHEVGFAADLQIFVICRLKFSLLSMCTPKSFTDNEVFIFF